MHDMVAHGLIAEEDLEQVKESLSDDTIATRATVQLGCSND